MVCNSSTTCKTTKKLSKLELALKAQSEEYKACLNQQAANLVALGGLSLCQPYKAHNT